MRCTRRGITSNLLCLTITVRAQGNSKAFALRSMQKKNSLGNILMMLLDFKHKQIDMTFIYSMRFKFNFFHTTVCVEILKAIYRATQNNS